jgi:NAD+ kinase
MNEVSVKDTTSMITIDTLNGEILNSYWADGFNQRQPDQPIPLSCGGPIPRRKGLVITPIAPHNLNARPLVIPDETEIKLKFPVEKIII